MVTEPSFTIGVEEEYLLVDRDTLDLADAPPAMMDACAAELAGQVSPEFLRCQVEVGTKVCAGVNEAREDLRRLRECIARNAGLHGLAPIAASCHPFADYRDQIFTDKDRYRALERDLAAMARRMLICGQHVHVAIEDDELRIDLMNQFCYLLPHLLALSASSPLWQGRDTGLASYRLGIFDNLPRTGLPPRFASWSEYQRSVEIIVASGAIEDASKIWWDIRPSVHYPTLESRICDVSPRLEDTLTLAALTQCLMRLLWRLRTSNQRWRIYDAFLIRENRWRAQRYGTSDGLIDFGAGTVVPFADLIDEMVEVVSPDAQALGCEGEVARAAQMARAGTSSDRQRTVFQTAVGGAETAPQAARAVVRSLVDEFVEGL